MQPACPKIEWCLTFQMCCRELSAAHPKRFHITWFRFRRNIRGRFRSRRLTFQKTEHNLANALCSVLREELLWPYNDTENLLKNLSQAALKQSTKSCSKNKSENQTDCKESAVSNENKAFESETRSSEKDDSNTRLFKQSNMASHFNASYSDGERYIGGKIDGSERKFLLFLEKCNQAQKLSEDRNGSFFVVLPSNARKF